jgi:hypothetical protein
MSKSELQVNFTVTLAKEIGFTNVSIEGGAALNILVATITAKTSDDDKYVLDVTQGYIQQLEDSIFQSVLSRKPQILVKMFDEHEVVYEIKDDCMLCSIEMDLFKADFILRKEQVDERTEFVKQISKLRKRVQELEERVKSVAYLEMPEWGKIEQDVMDLFDQFDPEFKEYKAKQHNTTKDAIVKGFVGTMDSAKKYAAWLTLIFYREGRMFIDADACYTDNCGNGPVSNWINAKFIRSRDRPHFRKFTVGDGVPPQDNGKLVIKSLVTPRCGCHQHKYGQRSGYISYVDI